MRLPAPGERRAGRPVRGAPHPLRADMFRQVLIVLAIGAALLAVSRWVEPPPGEWPQRPIELVVFSAPGGGLDIASRVLAAAMADELGAEIRVSNMTGGRGGVAAHYVYGRKHDGYRWLAASEAVLSLATRRAHPSTSSDWHPFVFAGSPGLISVPTESRFRTFAELMQAVRAEPTASRWQHRVAGASGTCERSC